jgi:hypothetical protein
VGGSSRSRKAGAGGEGELGIAWEGIGGGGTRSENSVSAGDVNVEPDKRREGGELDRAARGKMELEWGDDGICGEGGRDAAAGMGGGTPPSIDAGPRGGGKDVVGRRVLGDAKPDSNVCSV